MKKLYLLLAFTPLVLCSFSAFSQSLKGVITDTKNETLPGVVVKDLTSGAGVASGIDGSYQLNLKEGAHKVEFILIGYVTQTRDVNIPATGSLTLNITLEEDIKMTEEVVVVGYGVQRKRDLTGAISRIDGKDVNRFPVPSFEAALQGQAAGVQVSQGSGLAGSGSLVRIRGIASVSAGGDPLYVVDGIPITQDQFLGGNSGAMNTNPLATINPNDIASIEVLKDASATGIYGSRGANGVILITTKRGSKKGTEFSYNTRLGIGMAASKPNMLNTEQYLRIRQEAWENDGGTGYVWLPNMTTVASTPEAREAAYLEAMKTNTNWVDETIGIGIKNTHNFSVSHKGEKTGLYSGISYDDNGSYLLGNSYRRLSARVNVDHEFSKKFNISSGVSVTRGINKRINAAWSGGLGEAMSTALPYYKVYNDDGSYYTWNNGYSNPVMYRENREWKYYEDRVLINLGMNYSPIKDLSLRVAVNADGLRGADYQYSPLGLNPDFTNRSESSAGTYYVANANGNFTANYLKTIKEKHNLNFLAGTEFQQSRQFNRYEKYFNATGLWVNRDNRANDTGVEVTRDPGSYFKTTETGKLLFGSVFGRINYNYMNKYFLQVVGRVDGSSRFGPNNKTGFFPSASGGWVISEEKFMKKFTKISFLKVRASWGLVGNSDIAQNAQFADRTLNGSYNQQPILYTTKLPNPNLGWESSNTIDGAIEVGLFKDRITATLDFYHKKTTNAILNVSLPQSSGFGSYTDNVAEILNRGIELSVTSYNISTKNFLWKTTFNIARNYNELVSIGKYTPDAVSGGTNDSRVIVGKPIGSFYLMQWSRVDPATGRPIYLDRNGNETFDYDNFQRQFVGTGLPKVSGGLRNEFNYKKWSLGLFATFSLGAKIFDSSGKRQMGVVTDWNMRTEVLDRWRQPGDADVNFPRMTLNETTYDLPAGFPWWNTSLFIYKADYFRMKNIDISYNFDLGKTSKIKTLTVGMNVTNLFTITNFPGLDPEIVRDFENPQDRNLSPNVTYLTPPQERSYNLNIGINF